MPQKKHKPEEIVAKLRQVDVLLSQGRAVAEAVRSIGVTEFTYYRWRKEFGGLKSDQVKRLKDLETENTGCASGLGPDAGQADPAGGCPGKLLLYSGLMMQAPSCAHPHRRETVLRSSCFSPRSAWPPHDGIRRNGRSHLSRAVGWSAA